MQLPSIVYNVLLQKFHTLIIIHQNETDGINWSISIDWFISLLIHMLLIHCITLKCGALYMLYMRFNYWLID